MKEDLLLFGLYAEVSTNTYVSCDVEQSIFKNLMKIEYFSAAQNNEVLCWPNSYPADLFIYASYS